MRLREAFSEDGGTLMLAEATLARLGLDEEATVPRITADGRVTGAVVACDHGLVEFSLEPDGALGTTVHAWRDVAPPTLTARTLVELQVVALWVRVRLPTLSLEVGSAPFELGQVDWQMASTPAAIEFWEACVAHTATQAPGGLRRRG